MSESDVKNSSSNDRQNVSFKFTKIAPKRLSGNPLEEENKDFVTSVDKSEIKSTLSKPKPKELVIPLIKKNNWRGSDTSQNLSSENKTDLDNLAVQELLKESSERNNQWKNREFSNLTVTIPLIMQNKVPEGYETDDRLDVSLRPEESKLEDYDRVPVEQFGMAMMRGMGWKEGDGIGNNNKKCVEPIEALRRPKGLGLGADASALKKNQEKAKDEKLELIKGAFVNIIQGPHKGFYGQILGLDEENARAIVKLTTDEKVTFPEFYISVVSKKEFDKESKIINRASYENYKREQEEKEKDEKVAVKKEKQDLEDSKNERKRNRDRSRERDSRKSEKRSRRHHSRERSEENHDRSSKSNKTWVKPQLRVRFIDDKYKNGRYFNQKMVVYDVMSSKHCSCKTDDGKYLDDISPTMLETVIPRDENAYVMIVQGKYSGELCTILKKDKSKCIATVQFLSDRNQALKIEYDSICEYVGDVAQFD
ncbi:g-patch domain and KOW motifs-containing protein [Trichonephila inaurata madagascariensis]|uniref:G-patch domain and KOW motifs-containing protein n=1 Tax=Trichonephila inaurata madagascariensis TaxID=2747483 RepID=A0A8X6XCF5_9ARAC|nr:g-patch domain and KOW motifs-containing protein [Trichonephila inaurata madagascariensis]